MSTLPESTVSPSNTMLVGGRLWLARLGWVTITSLSLVLLFTKKNPHWLLFNPLIEDSYQLIAPLMTYRGYLQYVLFMRYLVAGFFILIAVLIFWRKSSDWLALVTSIELICLPYIALFSGGIDNFKLSVILGDWLSFANGLIIVTGILSIPILLFVFPDGLIQPRRLAKPVRWLFIILLLAIFIAMSFKSSLPGIGWFVPLSACLILILMGITGQVYRYKRVSIPAQRQQTKWILFSILVNLLWAFFLSMRVASSLRFTDAFIYGFFELHASLVIVAFIPIATAISVLRYRLFDIDVIIRKTLVYGALTATLALIFFSGITLLQGVFGRISGTAESPVAIVLSTLAIAALFTPLRRRIQDFIDRRFFRKKYNAEQALAEFTAVARSETDMEQLTGKLVEVVSQTMQPERVSLWLKSQGKLP